MRKIGFSTGALAYGDFQRGIELQMRDDVDAIELSALRENELDGLINALDSLDLSHFSYVSFHAPSSLGQLSSTQLAEKLIPVAGAGFPIILHPDVIGEDFDPWRQLGASILLENMDSRKPVCRTMREMLPYFEALPEARLCFDIGHAHQVDSTMTVAFEFLHRFQDKLAELHISEVNWQCKHRPIGTAAALSFHKAAKWLPAELPVIIESVISEDAIDLELSTVKRCLDTMIPYFDQIGAAAVSTG